MRVSHRTWSGGTGKHGGTQHGTVLVYGPGEAPPVRGPEADGLVRDRQGRVLLVCGGRHVRCDWRPATAPPGSTTTGPWLQCSRCGWWKRPEGYTP